LDFTFVLSHLHIIVFVTEFRRAANTNAAWEALQHFGTLLLKQSLTVLHQKTRPAKFAGLSLDFPVWQI